MKPDWDNPLPYDRRSRRHLGAHGLITGAAIILVGVLLLLNNLGILQIGDFWRLWPLFLIVPGLGKMFGGYSPRRVWAGGLMVLIGVLFLLDNLHIVHANPGLIIPIVLIGIGILFLIRSVAPGGGFSSIRAPRVGVTSESSLGIWAVFSGVKRRIDSPAFTGGEILAVFGGVNLDLRSADIQADEAVIEANATFGGIEIRVPDTWSVNTRGLGLFGGYQDQTSHPPAVSGGQPAKRLIVTGYAVFGGVEIRN